MIYRSEGEIVNKHEIWIINHYAITPTYQVELVIMILVVSRRVIMFVFSPL